MTSAAIPTSCVGCIRLLPAKSKKNTKRDTVITRELKYSMGVQNNICLNTVLKSKSGLKLERWLES